MSEALYRWEHIDGVAFVELIPVEIRHPSQALELGDQLRFLLAGGERKILIDCNRVAYMSSTGFATLFSFAKAVKDQGGRICVAEIHPDVRIGADIIRLGDVIPIYDDRRSALASFSAL
jgi:anti-anti-sigma factor